MSSSFAWKPKNLNRVGTINLQVSMNTDLSIENFRELPAHELEGINGGGILPFLGSLALIIVQEVVSDWDNFKNGLTGQPEEK